MRGYTIEQLNTNVHNASIFLEELKKGYIHFNEAQIIMHVWHKNSQELEIFARLTLIPKLVPLRSIWAVEFGQSICDQHTVRIPPYSRIELESWLISTCLSVFKTVSTSTLALDCSFWLFI